jgi:hypothetical protein
MIDGGDFAWFESVVEDFDREPPENWKSLCEEICAELMQTNPSLLRDRDELTDDESAIQIGFYDNGTASISIAGWGSWETRAQQIRMYLDVFEKYGFAAYDSQIEQKWERGWSETDIAAMLGQFKIPEITSTDKGSSLKPLTDEEWDRMM